MPLTEDTRREIEAALVRYPERRTAVLDALRVAQKESGHLSSDTVREVADIMGLDANALFSLVTFYDLFHDQPVGEHVIMICRSISCYLRGSDELIQYLSEKLGVPVGGTTSDGKFTIKTMECLASCGTGPAMILNERYYENLTKEKLDDILMQLSQAPAGDGRARLGGPEAAS